MEKRACDPTLPSGETCLTASRENHTEPSKLGGGMKIPLPITSMSSDIVSKEVMDPFEGSIGTTGFRDRAIDLGDKRCLKILWSDSNSCLGRVKKPSIQEGKWNQTTSSNEPSLGVDGQESWAYIILAHGKRETREGHILQPDRIELRRSSEEDVVTVNKDGKLFQLDRGSQMFLKCNPVCDKVDRTQHRET